MFYKSLSKNKREEFHRNTNISPATIKNAYMPKDPLCRKIPRPETMVAMINASDGRLTPMMLVDYFCLSCIQELMVSGRANSEKKRLKRNISVTHIEA